MNKKDNIKGAFDRSKRQEDVMKLASNYHYRNAILHDDGSMGEIRITPKQLNDLLAFLIDRER